MNEPAAARFLIAYGSRHGSTAGLADMMGACLHRHGREVVVSPAREVADLHDIDAVIVVGSLYANRWHRDACRFVRRHAEVSRRMPIWLVSTGLLDDSADRGVIPPTKQLVKLAARVGARGQVTFGGCLLPDTKGFVARAMAKTRAGDWRNSAHIESWVTSILHELETV